MEEKDYITNKATLSSLTKTYSESDSDSKGLFKRKTDPIKSFGDSQNEFNKNVVKGFDDTNESLEELNKKIVSLETKLTAVVQQNDALKSRVNKLQQGEVAMIDGFIGSIQSSNGALNEYIRSVSPEKRRAVSNLNGCKEVNEAIYMQLSTDTSLKSKKDVSLEDWGKVYKATLRQELKNMGESYASKVIAVVCKEFISTNVESSLSEAIEICNVLKSSSVYNNVKLITIESAINKPIIQGDIVCLPQKGFQQYLDTINPRLCIVCDSTLGIFEVSEGALLKYKSIVRLSGQNPLKGVSEDTIKQLTYLNDLGVQQYLVQTKAAYDVLRNNGFHEPTIALPIFERVSLKRERRVYKKEDYTVGYATSQSGEGVQYTSDVEMLCEVAKAMPKTRFQVLWTHENVPVPESLKSLENCTVNPISSNINEFYAKIDCVLVPATEDFNEAYPTFALNAMRMSIPVVCTQASGMSDLVSDTRLGMVSSGDVDTLVSTVEMVRDSYDYYANCINYVYLDDALKEFNLVEFVETMIDSNRNINHVPLQAWEDALKANGKVLVAGAQEVTKFCSDTTNFRQYLEAKYSANALKCLDYILLQNVTGIIEDRFEDYKPRLLDVSFGDTRVSKECAKYGDCSSSNLALEAVDPNADLYDIITCSRYLAYLDYVERKTVYARIASALKMNGILILDVPNVDVEVTLRNTIGWNRCNLFETAWSKGRMVEELEKNGFRVQYIIPVGQGMLTNLPNNVKKLPAAWTLAATRIRR